MAELSTKELLETLKDNSDPNGINSEGATQTFDCRSSWLDSIIWSPTGKDDKGMMTITFIPGATNGKPAVNVYGVNKHYAHSFANAFSPGQKYLNEIAGGKGRYKTSSFKKLSDIKDKFDSIKDQSEFYERATKKYLPASITKHIDTVKKMPKQTYVAMMRSNVGTQIQRRVGAIGKIGKDKFKNSVYLERNKLYEDLNKNKELIIKAYKNGGSQEVIKVLGQSSEYIKKYAASLTKFVPKTGVAKTLLSGVKGFGPISIAVSAVFNAVKSNRNEKQAELEKKEFIRNVKHKGFETDREKLERQLNNPNSRLNRNPERAAKIRQQLNDPNSKINKQDPAEVQARELRKKLNNPNSRLNRKKNVAQKEEALARLDLLEKAGYV